jgi:hypothetical protein
MKILSLSEISDFLARDKDITYPEEFSYIYITLKETIKILYSYTKDLVMCKFIHILYSIY